MVRQIADLAAFEKEIGLDKVVVVDFSATWCGPCRNIAPFFEKLEQTFPNASFIKVDVDENEEAAGKYEVSAMPTFMVFKKGAKLDVLVGASEDKLNAMVTKHAS